MSPLTSSMAIGSAELECKVESLSSDLDLITLSTLFLSPSVGTSRLLGSLGESAVRISDR